LSFPQAFPQPIGRLARDSGVFHSRPQGLPDDLVGLPDASVTRSIDQILRDTSTARTRAKRTGTRR
jgi:hypothetical protein